MALFYYMKIRFDFAMHIVFFNVSKCFKQMLSLVKLKTIDPS